STAIEPAFTGRHRPIMPAGYSLLINWRRAVCGRPPTIPGDNSRGAGPSDERPRVRVRVAPPMEVPCSLRGARAYGSRWREETRSIRPCGENLDLGAARTERS